MVFRVQIFFRKMLLGLSLFYHEKLGIPVRSTIVDDSDGVHLGFLENAPDNMHLGCS